MNLDSISNVVTRFDIDEIPHGTLHRFFLHIMDDGVGMPIYVPVFVARGLKDGPRLGFTAAVHGNELNGVKVVHRLIHDLEGDLENLSGTVVAVPLVNTEGAVRSQRYFNSGEDLNRIMPGNPRGTSSQQFAARFMKQVVKKLDYLVDLHTASFGRVNSLYVRADMEDRLAARLAKLQDPDIILHNKGRDGSLRGAAAKLGIPAITIELGDPLRFQKRMIKESLVGIYNIMAHLKMMPVSVNIPKKRAIMCYKSYWLYTQKGGILEVFPGLGEKLYQGQMVARLVNLFGDPIEEYYAPEKGVVIGKNVNPICQTGSRILHLGIMGKGQPTA